MSAIMLPIVTIPDKNSPFPNNLFAITFPITFTCPPTTPLPTTRTILDVTFDASTLPVAVTLPIISMFWLPDATAVTPINPDPLPKKVEPTMFPSVFTCPRTLIFPVTLNTEVDTFVASTFALAITLPMTSTTCVPPNIAVTFDN
ncbi:hypothetical protein NY2A_b050R [Paramecium bursaria Chlorella virus NY2A]|uniref:Uncharacterized protein b050R n=1 Tax=Paramecium bursaria Chlorella virus NY2A TaxID=46021 RepID=A7IVS5_PBCVN|nr:hypothetical protein NY2A_b050R [Paramecium bursaria Chlorella virus NY2A]ABT14449.1 hypothetical protein NY2A_b050R [Paramecium bursaria Chlorella virus NY2A]